MDQQKRRLPWTVLEKPQSQAWRTRTVASGVLGQSTMDASRDCKHKRYDRPRFSHLLVSRSKVLIHPCALSSYVDWPKDSKAQWLLPLKSGLL